jgi:heme/copper-type cytochrome/quinol oxidase subunit 4
MGLTMPYIIGFALFVLANLIALALVSRSD